jgi:hypothetical protein
MKRGRPFEPGNKFGRGRPKGSPNKKTQLAHKIFDDNSAAIMALAINASREDRQMLRMLASYVVPRRRESPIRFGNLPTRTLTDLDQATQAIFRRAGSGKIGLSEALDVCTMIENRRRVLMTLEIEQRLSALESGGRQLKEAA